MNLAQQNMTPLISEVKLPCNCGGGGCQAGAHHCAKLFQFEVHVKNLIARPVVEIPKARNFSGAYKDKPGRLQCKMKIVTPNGTEKETLLNLGVATIMSDASQEMSPRALEKLRVGLQYCKTGSEKYVQADWDETTGTAVITFKVRARRIRQHNDGWELKDDAGSGIRGKPHESSAFRFWACLQHSDFSLENSKPVDEIIQAAISANSGTYRFTDVRVWSKGNCPGKQRKNLMNETRNSPRAPKYQLSAQQQQTMMGPAAPLAFLPVGIPMHLAAPVAPQLILPQLNTAQLNTVSRGTKRPTIFTNISATISQHDQSKRVKVESDYLLHDDSGLDDELGFMVGNLCDKNSDDATGMDEIESIIKSLDDDESQRQVPQEDDDLLLSLPELDSLGPDLILGMPVC